MELCQQGEAQDRTDTRNAAQQLVLLPPEGTLAEGVAEVFVQVFELVLEPGDVRLNAWAEQCASGSFWTRA